MPCQAVFQEDGEISRRNSTLKPTTSDNLDVLVEYHFKSVGLVSGGVLRDKSRYKSIAFIDLDALGVHSLGRSLGVGC